MLDFSKVTQSGLIDDVYYKYHFVGYDRPIVITFGSLGTSVSEVEACDEAYSPWGFKFIASLGFNVLSFSSFKESNWYRSQIFRNELHAVSRNHLSKFSKRIAYGASMGGYGAFSFYNDLMIDHAVLLNPIATLNREIVPWETRPFQGAADKFDWKLEGAIPTNKPINGYVIFDPLFELDKKHAEFIKGVSKVNFRGVGHQIPKHLQSLGILKKTISDMLNDSFDSEWFYKELRKRREYDHYFLWLMSEQNVYKTFSRVKVISNYLEKFNESIAQPKTSLLSTKLNELALKVEPHSFEHYNFLVKAASEVIRDNKSRLDKYTIDFLRDIAVLYRPKDKELAILLMSFALSQRPNAPFMNRKLAEWRGSESTSYRV